MSEMQIEFSGSFANLTIRNIKLIFAKNKNFHNFLLYDTHF